MKGWIFSAKQACTIADLMHRLNYHWVIWSSYMIKAVGVMMYAFYVLKLFENSLFKTHSKSLAYFQINY